MFRRWNVLLLLLAAVAASRTEAMSLHRLAEAKALITAQRAGEAVPKLEALLAEARRENDTRAEGFCQLLLGSAFWSEGRLFEMIAAVRRGAETLLHSDDFISAALAYSALGSIENGMWRLDAAVAAHETALRLLREGAAAPPQLDGIPLLDDLLGTVGASRQLVELLVSDAYVRTLMRAGRAEDIERELNRTKAAAAKAGGTSQASWLSSVGDLRRLQLRLGEARDHYLAGLLLAGKELRPEIAGKLADLEILTGNNRAAYEWNGKALAMAADGTEVSTKVTILIQRGGDSVERRSDRGQPGGARGMRDRHRSGQPGR